MNALRRKTIHLVHSHGLSAGLSSCIAARWARAPHVMTLHDVFSEKIFSGKFGTIKRLAANVGLRLVDHVHLVGEDPKQNLLEYFPYFRKNEARTRVIRSGIETERFVRSKFEASPEDRGARFGIPNGGDVLGFFGRFMSPKGFADLVEAIANIAETDGVDNTPKVVAFGQGGFIDREKRLVKSKGLTSVILFRDFVPNIAQALPYLDGVAMPSRSETGPILPMEILVHGTPLIASDCIGLREVVSDTPAFTFRTNSVSSLVDAIRSWRADKRYQDFIDYSATAAERFDVKKTASAIENWYESILEVAESGRDGNVSSGRK